MCDDKLIIYLLGLFLFGRIDQIVYDGLELFIPIVRTGFHGGKWLHCTTLRGPGEIGRSGTREGGREAAKRGTKEYRNRERETSKEMSGEKEIG